MVKVLKRYLIIKKLCYIFNGAIFFANPVFSVDKCVVVFLGKVLCAYFFFIEAKQSTRCGNLA